MSGPNRRRRAAATVPLAVSIFVIGGDVQGQSLVGSSASLDVQNAQAAAHDFSYLENPSRVRAFVEAGYLVPVTPNRDFDVHQVSFPYARPEAKLFIERLASQYRAACGEKLVVTSLTRPISAQPWNASDRSVHPTGMAIDLRVSNVSRCRQWLESTLLSLEGAGVLEATRERRPPHYHLALFPQPYVQYVARMTGQEPRVIVAEAPAPAPERDIDAAREIVRTASTTTFAATDDPGHATEVAAAREHVVRQGETLGSIAMLYGTSVARIRADNGLAGDRIVEGQRLVVEWTGPATTIAVSEPLRHRVGRGESLWTIARLYDVTEAELRALNGIGGSRILVGQVLEVPASPQGGEYLQHTVDVGDSLWTIADRYGASVAEIRRTNGIGGSRIYAGQVIRVPLAD